MNVFNLSVSLWLSLFQFSYMFCVNVLALAFVFFLFCFVRECSLFVFFVNREKQQQQKKFKATFSRQYNSASDNGSFLLVSFRTHLVFRCACLTQKNTHAHAHAHTHDTRNNLRVSRAPPVYLICRDICRVSFSI